MERHRTLKRYGPGNDRKKNEPYRVPLDNSQGSQVPDGLSLKLFDERDEEKAIVTIIFDQNQIRGRDSLHFTAAETNGNWDISFHGQAKFDRIVLPTK